MAECIECGTTVGIVMHHVNYETDETVPACRGCHQRIHADREHPLFPVGEPTETSMRMSAEIADELFRLKQRRGESYEDVIWRLIEKADKYDEVDDPEVGDQ